MFLAEVELPIFIMTHPAIHTVLNNIIFLYQKKPPSIVQGIIKEYYLWNTDYMVPMQIPCEEYRFHRSLRQQHTCEETLAVLLLQPTQIVSQSI
jgi:hypothetical protein